MRRTRPTRSSLSNATIATIEDGTGLGTITDDDPPVAISVDDVSVLEGNFGLVSATFNVSLSSDSGRTVSVDYATANGTTMAPVDYLAATGTLTFAAGQATKQVTVLVNGDLLDEANETYFLNLANAANATIADGQGLGTITNDDGPPSLSVNDVTVTEGDSGTTERQLHRHAGSSQWAERECGLLDRGWYGDRTRRLRRDEWHAHVRRGPDGPDRHRADPRRRDGRARRDVHGRISRMRSMRRSQTGPGSARSSTTIRRRRSRSATPR